jgi:hypothetical protein
MTELYSIYEFTSKMKPSNIEEAEMIYNRYIHIVQMRVKDADEAQQLIEGAEIWFSNYCSLDNLRIYNEKYRDDYFRDEYDYRASRKD